MIESACHDSQAEHYDSKIKRDQKDSSDYIRENYDEIHQIALTMLDLQPHDVLLDIGIGTGLLEEKIHEDIRICGIDISERMLNKAREKEPPIELKVGSFLAIPYPDQSFNKIVTCFAFHHLDDTEKCLAIKEIFRVLKENGVIVIADFMYKNHTNEKELKDWFKRRGRIDMIEEMEEENFTDIEWLKEMMEGYGYTIDKKKGSRISWVVKASNRSRMLV
jgi:putative AdoMet-dependent methyltransferase